MTPPSRFLREFFSKQNKGISRNMLGKVRPPKEESTASLSKMPSPLEALLRSQTAPSTTALSPASQGIGSLSLSPSAAPAPASSVNQGIASLPAAPVPAPVAGTERFAAPVAPARLSVPDQIARSKAIINAYQQAQKPSVNQRTAAAQVPVTPAPVAPAPVAPAPVAQQPMYTKHEGMLFGDDFYDSYAQNVGGQFKDPYHNFLKTRARVIGPDNDIANLYKQYQASGRTDTPDWAKLDTTGPMSMLPVLSSKWDASGATPVDRLSAAWNSTTPLAEGVTVPEGYWDNQLAYNMNMSKTHPDATVGANAVSQAVLDNNLRAQYAMSQGEYGNQGELFNSYLSPSERAQQAQRDQAAYQQAVNQYNRMRENNNAHAAMYGYSAAGANSNLDARLAELEAEFAARRAQDEANQAAALQTQMNSARYAKGGIVNLRRR